MDDEKFFRIHKLLQEVGDDVLGIKGMEYPANSDRLSNFKEVAKLLGLETDQVAMVYLMKHVLAIASFIRDKRKDMPGHESIIGRCADVRNYLSLMLAIFMEQDRTAYKVSDPAPQAAEPAEGPPRNVLFITPDDQRKMPHCDCDTHKQFKTCNSCMPCMVGEVEE